MTIGDAKKPAEETPQIPTPPSRKGVSRQRTSRGVRYATSYQDSSTSKESLAVFQAIVQISISPKITPTIQAKHVQIALLDLKVHDLASRLQRMSLDEKRQLLEAGETANKALKDLNQRGEANFQNSLDQMSALVTLIKESLPQTPSQLSVCGPTQKASPPEQPLPENPEATSSKKPTDDVSLQLVSEQKPAEIPIDTPPQIEVLPTQTSIQERPEVPQVASAAFSILKAASKLLTPNMKLRFDARERTFKAISRGSSPLGIGKSRKSKEAVHAILQELLKIQPDELSPTERTNLASLIKKFRTNRWFAAVIKNDKDLSLLVAQNPSLFPLRQEKSVMSRTDPLRSFDIPMQMFGVEGDTLAPTKVPKNFETLVQAMRACGRRRLEEAPQASREGEPSEAQMQLKREAKFLGITEVEYKALLLASGKSDPGGWNEEIAKEKQIQGLLNELEASFDEGKVPLLIELLKNHPPLGKPGYYKQLYGVMQKVRNPEQQKEIKASMRRITDGISSRKLGQFRQEVLAFSQESAEELLKPIFKMHADAAREITERRDVQDRHGTIIQFIDQDLALLERLRKNEITLEAAHRQFKSITILQMLIQAKDENVPLGDRIQLGRKKLQEARDLQQVWKDHPEQSLRYFHATAPLSYETVLKSKVAVVGGGYQGAGSSSYSGAFVSTRPLASYGSVAFGFGEDLEYHARAVQTHQWGNNDSWLGFDRAIVPDPETARRGNLFRQNLRQQILDHPAVKKLKPYQRAVLEIGLARWLENDLDVIRTGKDSWEATLTLPDGKILRGDQMIFRLVEFPPFEPEIAQVYRLAFPRELELFNVSKAAKASEQDPFRDEPHMRALIVFDEEPLLQLRHRLNFVFAGLDPQKILCPTKQEVRQKCNDLGIRIDGRDVPIIPWTVAEICADYDTLFGLRQFGEKPYTRATKPISRQRQFF